MEAEAYDDAGTAATRREATSTATATGAPLPRAAAPALRTHQYDRRPPALAPSLAPTFGLHRLIDEAQMEQPLASLRVLIAILDVPAESDEGRAALRHRQHALGREVGEGGAAAGHSWRSLSARQRATEGGRLLRRRF